MAIIFLPKIFCNGTLTVQVVLIVGFAVQFSSSAEQHYADKSNANNFHRNVVVSNGPECAPIGMKILTEHNGTAVDAMIATLFCEGITISHSMGIGGGFFATIYDKSRGKMETLIARERAPLAATKDMFKNVTKVTGIMSVAVPAEVKGYAEMHEKYGRVPWKILVQPTIDLCRTGYVVTQNIGNVLKYEKERIFAEHSLKEIFVNPATNDVWQVGDRIRRLKLAETLEIIANEGVQAMYSANGTIAKLLVKDMKQLGGIITIEDFVRYETEWKAPVSTKLKGNHTLHSVPLPASGMVLALILNMLNGFQPSYSVDFFHQMIESFKYGYGKRTLLGDLSFNQSFIDQFSDMKYAKYLRDKIRMDRTFTDPRHYGAKYAIKHDHGTAHISVLAANGDAVSVTSSVNNYFGSRIRSRSTGIILNDVMDDFASTGIKNGYNFLPSPANFIKPGKRPLSSMCPIIVLDANGDAVFLAGAKGGSKITTTVASIFVNYFWLNKTLKESVAAKRLHHQLMPMEIKYESGVNAKLIDGLRMKGHKMTEMTDAQSSTFVTTISRARGYIEAEFDPRIGGGVEIN